MMTDERLMEFIEQRIIAPFEPLKVILFGSRARGDAGPDSDVDLLVVMPGQPDKRALAIQMRRNLRDLPLPKDVIVTCPDEIRCRGDLPGSVLRTALREGRVVFERD